MQWISEVMHFCAGLPIILVGCKKDLRRDQRVIEELRKTNQRPDTPEEVRTFRVISSTAHPVQCFGGITTRHAVSARLGGASPP